MTDPIEHLRANSAEYCANRPAIWAKTTAGMDAGFMPGRQAANRRAKVAGAVVAVLAVGAIAVIAGHALNSNPASNFAGITPTQTEPSPSETGPAQPENPQLDPVDLVNLWRVKAAGEELDTWLRLDAGSYQLWRECGFVEGGWRADSQVFFATAPQGASGDCLPAGAGVFPSAPWLTSAVAYQPSDNGWLLIDANGAKLAFLTIDGAPPPDPNSADYLR